MEDKKIKNQYSNTIKTLLSILGVVTVILTIITLIIVDKKINSEKPYTIELYEISEDGNSVSPIGGEIKTGKPNQQLDYTKYDLEGYTQILTKDYKKDAIKKVSPNSKTVFKLYFKKKSFEIIFKNIGNSDFDNKTVKYKDLINLSEIQNPTKENHVFKHWSLIENGKEFDFTKEQITKDIVLYPVFERPEVEYKVIFHLQNVYDDDYTVKEITKKGLVGEKVYVDYSTEYGFDYVAHGEEKIETILTTEESNNQIICYLNRKVFEVNFNLDGGVAIVGADQLEKQKVKYEGKIKEPLGVTIEKLNSMFEYWVGYGSEKIDFNTYKVKTDIALRAHYKITTTSCKIEPYFENIEGNDFILNSSKIVIKDVNLGDTYNFTESDLVGTEGFTFDPTNVNSVLSVEIQDEKEYLIKVYYTRNEYNIKVQYLKPNYEKVFDLDEEIVQGKYNQELVFSAKESHKGYKYTGEDKTYTITSLSEQKVEFIYEIDEDQIFEGVVNYYIEGTENPVPDIDGNYGILSSKKEVLGYVTQEIDIDFPNFDGINEYVLVEGQAQKIIISEKVKAEVKIYYRDMSKQVDVQLNHGAIGGDLPKLKYFKNMPTSILEEYISSNVDNSIVKPEYREYDGIAYTVSNNEHFIKSTDKIVLPDSAENITIYWRTPKDFYYDFDSPSGGAGAKINKFINMEDGTTIIPSRTAWDDTIPVGLYSNVLTEKKVKLFINHNVKQIFDRAFYNCKKIEGQVLLNQDITKIESQAFYGCENITEINSNTGKFHIESIGDSAFENMKSLRKIGQIPNILSIGKSAFKNCIELSIDGGTLNLSTLTVLGKSAFEGCIALTSTVLFGNELKVINEFAFKGSGIKGSLDLSNVREIKKGAFELCKNLNGTITFCDELEIISQDAFRDDVEITGELKLPSSLRVVEDCAFYACKKVTRLKLNEGLEQIGEHAFSHLFSMVGETSEGNLTFPNSVKKMKGNAFLKCKSLVGVVKFPVNSEFTEIGVQSFQGCEKIKQLVIPNNIIKIGARAFMECKSIDGTVDISSIVEINESVFEECRKVSKFMLSSNLKIVKRHAFYNCAAWEENGLDINAMSFIDRIDEGAFYGCYKFGGTLKLPEQERFLIQRQAFALCGFTKVDFGNKIKAVAEEAFFNCLELAEITLYDSLTSIGARAFSGCNKLAQDLVFESKIEIEDEAFMLSGIKSIRLKKANSSIGKAAFKKCDNLQTITLKDTEETANTWTNWKEGLKDTVIIKYNQ